jgi:predicted P-loop ATPase
MSNMIDFKSLNFAAMQIWQIILSDICAGGKLSGKEYIAGSVRGGDGRSFSFNTESGVWKDFSTGEGGADIISLYAAAEGLNQRAAAEAIQEKYVGKVNIPKTFAVVEKKQAPKIIKPPKNAKAPNVYPNQQIWCYKDELGDPLFYVVRGIDRNTQKKTYFPYCFSDAGKWIAKHHPNPPLYNLDKIKNNPEKWILMVEGEKTAEAAQKIVEDRYIVTTWSGGVNRWNKTDMTPLAGRKILLWPDADDFDEKLKMRVGQECMTSISVFLAKSCKEVKIINPYDKSGGWDAADALIDGWGFKDFSSWAKPKVESFIAKEKQELVAVEMPNNVNSIVRSENINQTINIQVNNLIDPEKDFTASPNNALMMEKIGMSLTKQGQPVNNAANAVKIIRHVMKKFVWRDVFHNENMTLWNVKVGEKARYWNEHDTNKLMVVLQSMYEFTNLTKAVTEDAINYIAQLDIRNEPQDWLNSLEWDGKQRIDNFFIRAMEAESNSWSLTVSKNFWLSMAARILHNGCQVDEMVVLESKQGTRKTTALRLIAGEYYGEANADIASKDFDQGLRGKIIVEFGELSNIKKTDVEVIKRKITSTADQYRPSYGRTVGKFPRTCIFVGTTNEKEYLVDMTGNRRFNPLRVGQTDVNYIKENRDQLFAEAAHRIKNQEPWWIYNDDEAREQREDRRVVDEWENEIESIVTRLDENNFIQTKDIYFQLGGNIDKLDKPTTARINKILRLLGYERKKVRLGQVTANAWVKIKERR